MSIADSRILKLFKVGATDGMTTTFVSTFHINNCVIGKYFGVKIISTFAPLKGDSDIVVFHPISI